VFRLGNNDNRGRPWTDVELRSGDLVVFGDESRLAYHGVPKLLPGVDVPDIGLPHGRLNLTLRVSGMADRVSGEAPQGALLLGQRGD
jgi:alkylated DNA repair protein (DNA oxidative demethylase)